MKIYRVHIAKLYCDSAPVNTLVAHVLDMLLIVNTFISNMCVYSSRAYGVIFQINVFFRSKNMINLQINTREKQQIPIEL